MSGNIYIRKSVLVNYQTLRNIAANKGISFPLFMKQTISQIAEDYKQIAEENIDTSTIADTIVVREVSEKTRNSLNAICKQLNCDLSTLLKIELKRAELKYPDRMKQKPLDY